MNSSDPRTVRRIERMERAYNSADRSGNLARREAIWAALRRLYGWKP